MSADPSDPPIIGIRRSRIQCDVTRGTAFGLTEFNTGRQPRLTLANALSLEMLFVSVPTPGQTPVVVDLQNASSLTAVFKTSQTAVTPILALQTVNSGSFTDLPEYAGWTAGTAQHVVFGFTSGQMNTLDIGSNSSLDVWLAVTAEIDGEERTLCAGLVTIEQDNNNLTDDPDGPVPPLLLAAQWFTDDGPPDNDLGKVGDFYLNLATGAGNGDIYKKTGVETWTLKGNISGSGGSGSGDVTGPASAVSGNLASFSDTSGKIIADSGLAVANVIVEGDSRLTNSRTPTAHASTHATAGSDPLTPADIGAEVAGAAAIVAGDLSAHEGLTTTAHGGIVASNDSRLTDARTPTAHASTHVTGGSDKIRDASAAQDGLMTTAYASKLDGIEANANNYVLPAPTTTVIGGVKRNTGSAGEFVTGIDTDGSLLRSTPSGGGDVVGPASATTDAVALYADTTGKLLKNGVVLGGAAQLNVGTGASTVAAGDDSRLTDERVPTAAGLTDKFSTAKGSIADDDRVAILDSAASLVPKHTLWSTIKTALNSLYVALSTVTTKGDILAATASATVARVGVGANGTVLTADSAETAGVKWAAAGGGSAGTDTLAVHTPRDNQPPASGFATLDTRNSIAVLDYDDAATEGAVFVGVIPQGAVLTSGLVASVRWMATSATSGNVRWSVAWEKSNTDLDADSFDTATAATAATNATSGVPTTTDITCTTIDSLAAGDTYRLRIQRLGADGADTMTGDAELIAVEIRRATA